MIMSLIHLFEVRISVHTVTFPKAQVAAQTAGKNCQHRTSKVTCTCLEFKSAKILRRCITACQTYFIISTTYG